MTRKNPAFASLVVLVLESGDGPTNSTSGEVINPVRNWTWVPSGDFRRYAACRAALLTAVREFRVASGDPALCVRAAFLRRRSRHIGSPTRRSSAVQLSRGPVFRALQ